jgi:protein translocase SecG subunit
MSMVTNAVPYLQIIFSVILVTLVLIQKSGVSAGGALGGYDNFSSAFHTRRGMEKWLFIATIVVSVLFAASAFVALILK